jgi:hypothetical protein
MRSVSSRTRTSDITLTLSEIPKRAPGLRPNYHANYYSAFVIGPDGYNIEAVCHGDRSA